MTESLDLEAVLVMALLHDLAEVIALAEAGTLDKSGARALVRALFTHPGRPRDLDSELGLVLVRNADGTAEVVLTQGFAVVITAAPDEVILDEDGVR